MVRKPRYKSNMGKKTTESKPNLIFSVDSNGENVEDLLIPGGPSEDDQIEESDASDSSDDS